MNNKTRKWRSAIAMVLVISMLFSIFPTAVFAAGVEGKTEINYVSLGDSMTNGYGLTGYDGNTGVEDYGKGSYANLFAQWLVAEGYAENVNHAQLAMSAMRAEDLHWLLELDYNNPAAIALTDGGWDEEAWNTMFTTGDYWTWNELCDDYRLAVAASTIVNDNPKAKITEGEAKIVAEYYQTAVKEADIISLGMGNGNFGVFAFGRIMEAIGFDGKPDDAMIYNVERAIAECDPEMQAQILNLKNELYAVVEEKVGASIESEPALEALANTVVYTGLSYVLNYAGSIEAILQLNPDAEIILVALMNTFADDAAGETVTGDVTIGDLLEVVFTPLNVYIAALPTVMQLAGNEVYADATFYYAEAPEVECLVNTYGDDFYNPNDGKANRNSTIRDRFVQDIVGYCDNSDHDHSNVAIENCSDFESGMIWDMLAGVPLVEGITLIPVTFEEVCVYDDMVEKEQAAYAAANTQKAVSIAVYLAFEDAVKTAGPTAPVSLNSVLGLGGLGADVFGGVMADFMANIGAASAEYIKTAAIVASEGLITEETDLSTIQYYLDNNDELKDGVEMLCMLLALPETLSASVRNDESLNGLLGLFSRCVVGNGLGGHPSAYGHEQLRDAVISAYGNGYTAKDATIENLKVALEAVKDAVVKYHPEMIAYAWQVADEEGYTDKAIQALEELDAMLVELASDLGVADAVNGIAPAAELNVDEEAYKEEIAEAIISARAAIAEAIKMLENEGSDGRTEAQLWAIIEKLEATLSDLYDILVLAAEDGAEYADEVIKEALTELDKVIQQAIADLEELAEEVANGVYDYIVKNAPEAIEELKNALYDLAVQTGDDIYWFLYENPDKVIAFFNEYGDEIWAVVEEYGDEVIGGILYFVADSQEEIGAFLVEYYPEILEFTWTLIEEHGENAAKLINVYAEHLGLCDEVRDTIAEIEKEIADLKDQLENELKKQLEDLKAELENLYEQLDNASEEVKAEIEAAIAEIEALIAEVEAAIEAIEAAIADLEAQLEAAQKALEEAIAAVEAVVEAIKEAVEAGVETVEEILAVIEAVVEFAEENIAGVKTAVEGIVDAVEDIVDFVEELIANGIVAAEAIEELIDYVMDIIDGVKAELEKGDIEAAIEEIRNQLTNGYEELNAMLAAIDTAIAEELAAIVAGLEDALAQAQDEFEEALYNATHGEIACDAKTIAVYGGETVATEDGYAAIVAEEWGLEPTEAVDMADVILYQADPQIFVTALLESVSGEYVADWTKYISDEKVLAYLEQAKAELVKELAAEYGEETAAMLEPIVDSFMFAVVEYAIANIETIEYLSEANEDALIVAVGMYNPVQGLSITYNGETIDIEALCQYLIEVTDVYNLLYAIAAQNAVFVDVSEAEAMMMSNVDVDALLARAAELKAEAIALFAEAQKALEENDFAKASALMEQANALYTEIDNIVSEVLPLVEALDSNYATEAGHAYIATQILNAVEKADHEYEWVYDENDHWEACQNCDDATVVEPHEFDNDEDTVCDVCGYTRVIFEDPEVTTSSIVVFYWNENNAAIKEATVEEITTTGSYEFAIPAIDNYNFVNVIDKDENDDNDYDVDDTTLTVNVNTMPTSGFALEFVLKYVAAGGGEEDDTIAVTGVTLDKDTLSLKVGNTAALTATVAPDNATNKAVTWASSDESVATVANGVVTAVAEGTATITVTTVDGSFTDTCAVTVTTSGGGSFGGGGGGGGAATPLAKHEAFIGGYPDGNFAPDKQITRGEAAAIFARLLADKAEAGKVYTSTFKDVPADLWSANSIGLMQSLGLLGGYEDGTFRPEQPITRAELIALVCRFKAAAPGVPVFNDVPSTHWAYNDINAAAAQGWTGGYEDGSFRPGQPITRAEVVSILCRVLDRNADAEYITERYVYLPNTFKDINSSHWAYWNVMEAANGHEYKVVRGAEDWAGLIK